MTNTQQHMAFLDQMVRGLEDIARSKPRKGRLPQFYRLSTLSERFDIPKSVLLEEIEKGELVAFKRGERWCVPECAAAEMKEAK